MEWSEGKRLAFYEKVADDETVAWEQRTLFARKANWLRIIARLQIAGGLQQVEARDKERAYLVDGEESEALLFSPIRMAANLRERADEACRKLLKKHKQPVGLMASLKESIGQRKTRTKKA